MPLPIVNPEWLTPEGFKKANVPSATEKQAPVAPTGGVGIKAPAGGVGIKAPAGMEYGPTGQLQAKTPPPALVDTSGQNQGVTTSQGYTPPAPGIGVAGEAMLTPTPPLPNMTSLVETSNIPTLQQKLTDIQAQKLELQNQFNAYKLSLQGRGIAAGIVDVQTNEQAKAMQIQLDSLNTQEAVASMNLNNAMTYTSMLMQATGQDYSNAIQQWERNFNNAVTIQNMYNQTATQQQNNASAYLTAVANMIGNTGVNWNTVGPTMKATIENMEVQAGWPMGTLESFAKAKPGANILGTVQGVDASGQNTLTFIYQGADGMPGMTSTITTGTYKETPLQIAIKNMQLARSSQMLETSKAMEATRIIGPQIRADPTLKRYAEALAVKARIDAAAQDIQQNGPTDPNTKELIDGVTQLMTGGQQITEGQIALNTQFQSYQSQLEVFANKFKSGGGGAIGATVANQIIKLANETYDIYQKSYQQRVQVYNQRLKDVGGQDLTPYSPLTNIENLPSVLDKSYDQSLQQEQSILGGLGGIDTSTLDQDQLQMLIDEGLIQ